MLLDLYKKGHYVIHATVTLDSVGINITHYDETVEVDDPDKDDSHNSISVSSSAWQKLNPVAHDFSIFAIQIFEVPFINKPQYVHTQTATVDCKEN